MSGFFFRLALGLAAVWALEAAAQDFSSERASPFGAESSDSYVADPAESYVTEGDAPEAETPVAALAPRPPYDRQQSDQPVYDRPAYGRPAYESAPYCRAYYPVGPGRDRSGTLCEQSDGSLRIVEAPRAEVSPRTVSAAASTQYCREYLQDAGVEAAYGKACWQRDGSWQIVSATLGVPGRDYPRAYAMAPDTREYAVEPGRRRGPPQIPPGLARKQTPDDRLKLPEFYFGNLFRWLRPREGRY